MKITLQELKDLIGGVVAEAKKKGKKKAAEPEKRADGWYAAEAFDYSKPLGAENLYKRQGGANFGPYTSENALRAFVGGVVREALGTDGINEGACQKCGESPCKCQKAESVTRISESMVSEAGGIWEALRWYDHLELGLGKQGALEEKHIGFNKLKSQLAHKKGVTNPGALAASIGRKKLGAKKMAAKSAAGRK